MALIDQKKTVRAPEADWRAIADEIEHRLASRLAEIVAETTSVLCRDPNREEAAEMHARREHALLALEKHARGESLLGPSDAYTLVLVLFADGEQ